jgi:hypothetical protein
MIVIGSKVRIKHGEHRLGASLIDRAGVVVAVDDAHPPYQHTVFHVRLDGDKHTTNFYPDELEEVESPTLIPEDSPYKRCNRCETLTSLPPIRLKCSHTVALCCTHKGYMYCMHCDDW